MKGTLSLLLGLTAMWSAAGCIKSQRPADDAASMDPAHNQEKIQKVAHVAARDCQRRGQSAPNGLMQVKVQVGPDAEVEAVAVEWESGARAPHLEHCIRKSVMRRLKLAPTGEAYEGVSGTYFH